MIEPNQNTGVIAVEPKLGDFIRGGETGILDTPVLPGGDWRPYFPTNAAQLMKLTDGTHLGDTNACVSFAACQDVETMLNFQLKKGEISPNMAWLHDNGYIDGNGSVYLSKRFTAKVSGTDPTTGNSFPNVWGSLKNEGAVPEGLWPMPTDDFDVLYSQNPNATINDYWAIYYAGVPQTAIDLGKQFVARFPILYEWLVYGAAPVTEAQLLTDLTVAPLEIATAVCTGWNTADPIQGCGPGAQHATLLGFVETNGDQDILDHYTPWQKQLASSYNITYAMRGVVGQATVSTSTGFIYDYQVNLTYEDMGVEVRALQEGLQAVQDASGQPYLRIGLFGPYGPLTRAAVAHFQVDHGIADIPQGEHFGPQTRAALTAALQALHN